MDALPLSPPSLDYEALFQDAPAGYVVTQENGIIMEANRTLLGWIGRTRSDLVGTNFLKLLPIGDRILYATHASPQMGVSGAFAELAVDLIAENGSRMPSLLSARRFAASEEGQPALDRIIVFNAHERRQIGRAHV